MKSRFLQLIGEANISNVEKLESSIQSLLDSKNVTKEPIKKWFMTQFKKWYTSDKDDREKNLVPHQYQDGEPEWMSKPGIMDFGGFDDNVVQKLNHIIDYFNTLDDTKLEKIVKIPYAEVLNQVNKWEELMKSRLKKRKVRINGLEEGVDYEVLKSYGKYYMAKLLSKKAYKQEGDLMGHCVGGYCPTNSNIVSLWDSKGMPHATLEFKDKELKRVVQIKGKSNEAPSDKYVPYIVDFIKSFNISVEGDGANIGMTEYENKFYWEDSDEWINNIKPKILAMQKKAIDDIMKRIVIQEVHSNKPKIKYSKSGIKYKDFYL